MKTLLLGCSLIIAAGAVSAPSLAQTAAQTTVSQDTKMKDGVATTTTTVTHTSKHKTRQPKKILGVKVGHKTVVNKIEKKTSVSSNGDTSTSVKTSN